MTIILNLLLALSIFLVPIASHPFVKSDFIFKLHSSNSTKQIPKKLDCSCQVISFAINDSIYSLVVNSTRDTTYTHAKLYVASASNCTVSPITDRSATFLLPSPSAFKNQTNQSDVTQKYWILFSPQNQSGLSNFSTLEQCFPNQQQLQYRQVYLTNQSTSVNYQADLPLNAIGLTQILALFLLLVLCNNIKYRRFTPFSFNYLFSILYILFLIVTVYVQSIIKDNLYIFFSLVMTASVVFSTLYFIDITSIFLSSTQLIVVISAILAITIAAIDIFVLCDAWYLNNLLGILVAGALIKFIVIKQLKSAVIPLVFLWIFFVIRQFVLQLGLENFQQALEIKIIPLFLQLPSILGDQDGNLGFICSAFGTSKIITMGLIVNFCVRIDLFLSTRFYTTLCIILATISLGIQFIILKQAENLPVLEYSSVIIFVPLALSLILMLSSKRGQWAVTWHGSFHDIAVNRKSIKRYSSKLDQQELDRNTQQLTGM